MTPTNRSKTSASKSRAQRKPTTAAQRREHPFVKRLAEAKRSSQYLNMLVFGPPRSGKTYFTGTGAFDERLAPVLHLDLERGDYSLFGLPEDKYTSVQVKNWTEFEDAIDYVESETHNYKTLVVDDLTELHSLVLNTIVDVSTEKSSKRDDPLDRQIQDFGKAMDQMMRFYRHLKTLPVNIICLAKAEERNIPRKGKVTHPSLFGQMASLTVGAFSIAVHLELVEPSKDKGGDPYRKLTLHSDPSILCGVRTPFGATAPKALKNPSMTTFLDSLSYMEQKDNG